MSIDDLKIIIRDRYFDLASSHYIKNTLYKVFKNQRLNTIKKNNDRTHRNFYVASKEPLIIFTLEEVSDFYHFSNIIKKERRATFIKLFPWTLYDGPRLFNQAFTDYNTHLKQFPKHKIIYLLNTEEEYSQFKSNNIPCEFVNQNALLDPNIFFPIKETSKIYNCIYNARFEIIKRHYLLDYCEKISLVSSLVLRMDNSKKNYIKKIKKIIPNAEILNFSPPKQFGKYEPEEVLPQLNPIDVNKYLNQSRVGMILSHKEGACYASAEYLLAGIPVISTKSIGGRDIFFDERYCKVVSSNKKAIRKAMDELIKQNIDSDFIRSEVIKKFKPHIDRLKEVILNEFELYGQKIDNIDQLWEKIYIHKMLKFSQPFPQAFKNALYEDIV